MSVPHVMDDAFPRLAPRAGLSTRTTLFIGLVAAGVAGTALTAWLVRASPILVDPLGSAIVRALFVASYFGVGLYTWRTRPSSRLGPLFVSAGVLQALRTFEASPQPVLFTFGRLMTAATVVLLVYLFVCFPLDHPRDRSDRRFLAVFLVVSAVLWALVLIVSQKLPVGGALGNCAHSCPDNPFRLVHSAPGVGKALNLTLALVTAAAVFWTLVLAAAHARATARLMRRAIVPVLIGVALLSVSYTVSSVLGELHPSAAGGLLRILAAMGGLAIPIAFFVGQVRGRAFAIAGMGRLLARAADEPVSTSVAQELVRDALGDPTAQLLLADPEASGYRDIRGASVALPYNRRDLSVISLAQEGREIGAVVYRTGADEDVRLVQGLATTSVMLLENARLLGELRASRARIATIADEERRRIERDLHDGTQQQLVAIQVRLSLLLDRIDEPTLAYDLERVISDADTALHQLRSLARGVYPDALALGLGPALKAAAREAPIPATVIDRGVGRAPAEVEAAIYFCALEALQNAVKHAGRGAHATITLDLIADRIVFSITDDGVGFMPRSASSGRGLTNMRDRVEAIGGTLTLDAWPGRGTSVVGRVDLAEVPRLGLDPRPPLDAPAAADIP